ncbi:hypothetical protein Patl1_19457 [Pistacia atlantica]|uniref:Uncharacterized protein n=1 Tax=Pistacia atlantica TaxID=434234 RepID=A0ACC1C3J8_9ROSI|nr:hypothetical protein Patl1_19457 [Pistacia atlantica]
MEDLLVDRDLWGVIVNDRPTVGTTVATMSETSETGLSSTLRSNPAGGELSATDRAALAEWDKMDRKARASLFRCKKLYNLRIHDGDSLAAHLDEFNTLVNKLLAVDVQLAESEKVVTLLCSFARYVGQSDCCDWWWRIDTDVVGICMFYIVGRGYAVKRGKSRGRSKSKDKSKIKSLEMSGNLGILRKSETNPVKGKEAETYKQESNGDMYVAAACMAGSDQSVWYVDTGASFHMTPHKEWFCEYETYNGGNVLLGDDLAL